MANYLSGSARKLSRSMGSAQSRTIKAVDDAIREGRTLKLRSITVNREGWTAQVRREGDRALGRLFQGAHVVRYAFNVKVDGFDRFAVDIGTGSGVKVQFHFGTGVVNA